MHFNINLNFYITSYFSFSNFILYIDKYWLIYSNLISVLLMVFFIFILGIFLLNNAIHVKFLNIFSAYYLIIFIILISLNFPYEFITLHELGFLGTYRKLIQTFLKDYFITMEKSGYDFDELLSIWGETVWQPLSVNLSISVNQNLTPWTNIFTLIASLTVFIFFLGVSNVFFLEENSKIEFSLLIWCIYISAMFLISTTDFIAVIILLECIAFSSYILVGFERCNKFSTTSALKYLLIAAIPGGLFILGLLLLYNNYGSFSQDSLNLILSAITNNSEFGKINFYSHAWKYINEFYFFDADFSDLGELTLKMYLNDLNILLSVFSVGALLGLLSQVEDIILTENTVSFLTTFDSTTSTFTEHLVEDSYDLYKKFTEYYFFVVKELIFCWFIVDTYLHFIEIVDTYLNFIGLGLLFYNWLFIFEDDYRTALADWFTVISLGSYFQNLSTLTNAELTYRLMVDAPYGIAHNLEQTIPRWMGMSQTNLKQLSYTMFDFHFIMESSRQNILTIFKENHLKILMQFLNENSLGYKVSDSLNLFWMQYQNYSQNKLLNCAQVCEFSTYFYIQIFEILGGSDIPLYVTSYIATVNTLLYYTKTYLIIYLVLIFILINLCFKITAAPFHIWAPNIYGGTPLATLTFLSIFSKLTIIFFMIWLFLNILDSFKHIWQPLFISFAFLSVFGSILGAFSEMNFKRFFVYSSTGHVGFLLLGMSTLTLEGVQGSIDYLILYLLSSTIVWFIIMHLTKKTITIVNFKGLYLNQPFLSGIFTITIFSLSGIPPLGGFFVKYEIFYSVINSSLFFLGYILLLFTVISFFYYLRIIKVLYFENFNTFYKFKNLIDVKLRIIAICGFILPFYLFFAENSLFFILKEILIKSLA